SQALFGDDELVGALVDETLEISGARQPFGTDHRRRDHRDDVERRPPTHRQPGGFPQGRGFGPARGDADDDLSVEAQTFDRLGVAVVPFALTTVLSGRTRRARGSRTLAPL